jgi:hypothetical protein
MMRRLTKKELLERYQAREPRLFVQIDAVKTVGNEDNLMPPDEDGFWFQARHTYEWMEGADISVLVNPETDRKDVVGMLKKLIIKIDQDWSYLLDEAKDELATAHGTEGIVESLIRIRGFQLNDFERLAQVAREKFEGKTVQSDDEFPFW